MSRRLRGKEFCTILNSCVRDDNADVSEAVAGLTRGLNTLCVVSSSGSSISSLLKQFPADKVLYRGGGFDNTHRGFFTAGRQFRQPSFLATSGKQSVAQSFIERAREPTKVRWRIRIHPQKGCQHVNVVAKSHIPSENEFLFAPYSVFTVLSAEWRKGDSQEPHVVELLASVDNRLESEALPLAPWS